MKSVVNLLSLELCGVLDIQDSAPACGVGEEVEPHVLGQRVSEVTEQLRLVVLLGDHVVEVLDKLDLQFYSNEIVSFTEDFKHFVSAFEVAEEADGQCVLDHGAVVVERNIVSPGNPL